MVASAVAAVMAGTRPIIQWELLLLLLTTSAGCTHTYASGGSTGRLLPLLPLPLLLALLGCAVAYPSAPTAPLRGVLMSAVSAATPPCLSRSIISSLLMNLHTGHNAPAGRLF